MGYAESQYIIDELMSDIPAIKGSGIPPKNVNFILGSFKKQFSLTWTVCDTFVQEKKICIVGSLIIVIKHGSAPQSIRDGEVIVELHDTEIREHETEPYYISGDGLIEKEEYYVRVFTVSDQGVINNEPNVKSIELSVLNPPQVFGFHQDFSDLDPATTISYIGDNTHFRPMFTNSDSTDHEVTMGDWSQWRWLSKIKPYMLGRDGVPVYELDSEDYSKKKDGSPSDISNLNFDGPGAFSWIPKIYVKEVYAADGNSRDVYFTDDKEIAENDTGYHNFVFLRKNLSDTTTSKPVIETEGYWLQMFHSVNSDTTTINLSDASNPELYLRVGKSLYLPSGLINLNFLNYSISGDTMVNPNTIDIYHQFDDATKPDVGMFTGAIVYLLRDILWLLYKTTDISSAAGGFVKQGNYYAFDFTGLSSDSANARNKDMIVGRAAGNAAKYTGICSKNYLPLTNGGFYGFNTKRIIGNGYASSGNRLTKLFHSFIIGGLLVPIFPSNIVCTRTITSYYHKYIFKYPKYIYSKLTSDTNADDFRASAKNLIISTPLDSSKTPYFQYDVTIYYDKLSFLEGVGSVPDNFHVSGLSNSVAMLGGVYKMNDSNVLSAWTTGTHSDSVGATNSPCSSMIGIWHSSKSVYNNTLTTSCAIVAPKEGYSPDLKIK